MPGLTFALFNLDHPSAAAFWAVVAAAAAAWGIAAILIPAWQSMVESKLEFQLKTEMLDRGMSADDIARVINTHSDPSRGDVVDLPCASEVVVHWEDDWYPALVLQVSDGKFYVHYIGNDNDENEWVEHDRIRFPAGSNLPAIVAQLRANPNSNSMPHKEPVEAEL